MIVYLAALQDIQESLYEVAWIDGSNAMQCFKKNYITDADTQYILCHDDADDQFLQGFDLVYLMTEGGPWNASTMMSQYIYNRAFISWN